MNYPKILKEPIISFLIAGLLLYISYTSFDNYLNRDEHKIVVSTSEIELLSQTWESRMNRPPTPQERQGLIDEYVKEMVLFKTALEMGLDKDDRVIRGRMVQKLEFLGNDLIRAPQPSEQDLITFYDKNKEQYIPEEMISITHIFFNPDKRENETLKDADKALQALRLKDDFDGEVSGYGDSFMLQNYYPSRSELEIRKLFGTGFTESVFQLETGKWHGPVLSGYGTHLVFVHKHEKNELPEYADVREMVLEDWMTAKKIELQDNYIKSLLARYEVIVEQ